MGSKVIYLGNPKSFVRETRMIFSFLLPLQWTGGALQETDEEEKKLWDNQRPVTQKLEGRRKRRISPTRAMGN